MILTIAVAFGTFAPMHKGYLARTFAGMLGWSEYRSMCLKKIHPGAARSRLSSSF